MKKDPNSLSIHEAGMQLPQLTVREHFAGLAMQGLMHFYNTNMQYNDIAYMSVNMADALIEELNKTER
jgi:hypothetical protein